jgi:hypothetical protein
MKKILKLENFLFKHFVNFCTMIFLTFLMVFFVLFLLYISNKFVFKFDLEQFKLVSVCIGFSCLLYCFNVVKNLK